MSHLRIYVMSHLSAQSSAFTWLCSNMTHLSCLDMTVHWHESSALTWVISAAMTQMMRHTSRHSTWAAKCAYSHECAYGVATLSKIVELQVSFAEYSFFYRALLQKRVVVLSMLWTVATPYRGISVHSHVSWLWLSSRTWLLSWLMTVHLNDSSHRWCGANHLRDDAVWWVTGVTHESQSSSVIQVTHESQSSSVIQVTDESQSWLKWLTRQSLEWLISVSHFSDDCDSSVMTVATKWALRWLVSEMMRC